MFPCELETSKTGDVCIVDCMAVDSTSLCPKLMDIGESAIDVCTSDWLNLEEFAGPDVEAAVPSGVDVPFSVHVQPPIVRTTVVVVCGNVAFASGDDVTVVALCLPVVVDDPKKLAAEWLRVMTASLAKSPSSPPSAATLKSSSFAPIRR